MNDDAPRPLATAANLGPKSAAMLEAVGIDSMEKLAALGSVTAYALVRGSNPRISLNLLWAMEGAITGQSWQTVAREHRASLLLALESHGLHVR